MAVPARRLLAVIALALAPAAAADTTYDVAREDVWKPGDVVTTIFAEDRYEEIRFPQHEAETGPATPRRLKTQTLMVEKCLETDAPGHKTRSLVWFSSWAVDNGTTKDDSLEGALVEVSGRGKDRAWKLVGATKTPSKPAMTWLARQLGGGLVDGDATRRPWLPKVAVAVGDEWGADLASVLEGVRGADKLDRTKATSSAKLAKVEKGRASIACAASLPLTALPAGKDGKSTPWTKGGVYVLKGTLGVDVGGRLVESTFESSRTLDGEAEADGRAVAVTWKVDRKLEVRVGGEMVDPLKVPPPWRLSVPDRTSTEPVWLKATPAPTTAVPAADLVTAPWLSKVPPAGVPPPSWRESLSPWKSKLAPARLAKVAPEER
jgi:hypothetical protein